MRRDVTGGGALRGSKLWCARRQRITDTCNIGGRRARALSLTDPSVSLAKCGRELLCARRCCPRSARRGRRKPRGTREASKTTATPTPTDWWVNKTLFLATFYAHKFIFTGILFLNNVTDSNFWTATISHVLPRLKDESGTLFTQTWHEMCVQKEARVVKSWVISTCDLQKKVFKNTVHHLKCKMAPGASRATFNNDDFHN